MLDRIKNPLFLAASISFLYNVTNYITKQFFGVTIDPNTWLTFFNLLLWVILGVGVYANYTPTQPNPLAQPIQPQPVIVPQVVAENATTQTIAPEPLAPEPLSNT